MDIKGRTAKNKLGKHQSFKLDNCPLFEINNKLKTISAKRILGSSFGRAIVWKTICSWFDSNPKYNSLVSLKIANEMYIFYTSHFFV